MTGDVSPIQCFDGIKRRVSVSSQRSGHNIRAETNCCRRIRYALLRILDSVPVRRMLTCTVILYIALGLVMALFDIELVCISPQLGHVYGGTSNFSRVPSNFTHVERLKPFLARRSLHTAKGGVVLGPDGGGTTPTKLAVREVLTCRSPYSTAWLTFSISLGTTSLVMSSTLVLDQIVRLLAVCFTSGTFFIWNLPLVSDFASTGLCFFTDLAILFFLRPSYDRSVQNGVKSTSIRNWILLLRLTRLILIFRVMRAIRKEWNPAKEIARAIEVLDLLRTDMPRIEITSVQVIKNPVIESRLYEEQRDRLEELHGTSTNEMTLFLVCPDIAPQMIMEQHYGLERFALEVGPLGPALYGAERPGYVDCCDAYVEWDNDPSGHTRSVLVFQALVGRTQDVEDQASPRRRQPDLGYDTVCAGPWFPTDYAPEVMGLPRRDVESRVYAWHVPRGYVLPVAIITYRNPESAAEIDRMASLTGGVARSWHSYAEQVFESEVNLEDDQAQALQSLCDAIAARDLAATEKALELCEDVDVPYSVLEEHKAQRKKESEEAGVSLAYILSSEFEDLARKSTGQKDPTFLDMKEPLFVNGTNRIGEGKVCPRDLRHGCAFVDTLPPEHRKPATHFLSWVWRYPLSIVRGALGLWAKSHDLNPREVFLFCCFFCNNQWRILVEGSTQGSDNLELVFEERLNRIGKMVTLMDSWDNPIYTQRIWTIFEQFMAKKMGIENEFILPSGPAETLRENLEKGKPGIQFVVEAISKVQSENAEASIKQDELKVKSLIATTIGFDKVDEWVKQSITSWIAREFKRNIDRLVLEADGQRIVRKMSLVGRQIS